MELNNLAEISFANCDEETVKAELIGQYEKITGRSLADGDPVRLFLLAVANILAIQRNLIDYAGKMNLLAYATGDYLDHLGALLDVKRLPAEPARTTITFQLSTTNTGAVIPQGTRVTTSDEKAYFATTESLSIPVGQTSGTVLAECTSAGAYGNDIAVGLINKLVDPLPYVATVRNTTVTAGGTDTESDASYRERIHEAPESFSNAGSYGSYEYWAKTANADITDVCVTSPSAGEVKIYPLLAGGEIPGQEVLNQVLEICSADKIRPITDHVTVEAPTKSEYSIKASYSIAKDDKGRAASIQKAVQQAVDSYVDWQKEKLGRDLDPSMLYSMLVKAGAKKVTVTSPAIKAINEAQIAIAKDIDVQYLGVDTE